MFLSEKNYFTAKECAAYLGLGLSSTRKYMKAIGAERRIGKSCRYDRRFIDSYLKEHGNIVLEKVAQ